MKNFPLHSLLILCIIALNSTVFAQNPETEIDAFIRVKMEQQRIPALQIAIVRNGSSSSPSSISAVLL